MDFQQAALVTCLALVAYVWYKLYRTSAIRDVPGPKNPSWVYGSIPPPPYTEPRHLTNSKIGHIWWWQREEARAVEKSLLEQYGTVARWNGLLGVCVLTGVRRNPILILF